MPATDTPTLRPVARGGVRLSRRSVRRKRGEMADSVEQAVKCGQCGAALSEPVNTPAEARTPCLSCGSTKRAFEVHLAESVQVKSYVAALQERQGEAIGFSESERGGRASSASLREDGLVDISLVGSSPQGEEDTPTTCRVLKERLNLDGAGWGQILRGSEPADCVLLGSEDAKRTLPVQVVRAIASQELWRELSSSGSAQTSLSPSAAVAAIRGAIEAKARDAKIPKSTRLGLVLALDATRLPGLAFDAIMREFRSTSTTWAASHGFGAIWLVGPTSRLVWRLDS